MKNIIRNAIRTPDGTELVSTHVHDFVDHTDANGEYYFTDGGNDYIRRSANKVEAEDLTVYDDAPHETIREIFLWGTYGKSGTGPLRRVPLCNLSVEHILAILDTQTNLPKHIKKLFENELSYRIDNDAEMAYTMMRKPRG